MNNKFKIIVPSFNNEAWVEYNVASILNQTYTNYEVLYIDDASSDSTYEKVVSIVKDLPNWKVVRNEVNKGATYNYVETVDGYAEGNDILVHLDGDDWFYDETVLEKFNNFYNEKDVWMTYGGFICYDGMNEPKLPYPQSTPHPDFVHEHKKYREDLWRASHLRTYRTFLFKAIRKEDIKSLDDSKYYWHGGDLAFQYPCMEMCPKDKIGVVDFYACVYNQTNLNQIRTRERESSENAKYEAEIRNRKKYREGLTGDKLPQINVVGDFRERNSIPKLFSYTYNLIDGEFDATLIQDMDCIRYLNGEVRIKRGKVIADIHEPPYLFQQQQVYDLVYENASKFDLILTYDPKLLTLPNAVFRNGGGEVVLNKNIHKQEYPQLADDTLCKIYAKKDLVSFITSNKTFTDGHKTRVDCVNYLAANNANVDIRGVGYEEVVGKVDALHSYMFSIAMENGCYTNYFTEKILDCFLTGTVPIYKGCPNLGDFFDLGGVVAFDTKQELLAIVNNLNSDFYYSRMDSITKNYELALKYKYDNDILFSKYLKPIL